MHQLMTSAPVTPGQGRHLNPQPDDRPRPQGPALLLPHQPHGQSHQQVCTAHVVVVKPFSSNMFRSFRSAHRLLHLPWHLHLRFSKDQGIIDDQLSTTMFDALQTGFLVLGALVIVCIAVPFIVPVFIPLAIAFVYIQRRYIAASREIKRLEAVTRCGWGLV